jgi:putative DNA primase/helicase
VGLLKAVSGGESMPVRELHQAEIEVRTTWTLWLVANEGDLPKVRAEDDAVWERIRRIPVGTTLPEAERSPALRESFSTPEARSAVLAWAVEGARAWYEHRLGAPPESVRQASAELRSAMDPAAPFIAAELRFDPATVTSKRQIRAAYTKWAEDRGDKPIGAKRLTASLRGAAQREQVMLSETTCREAGLPVPAWRGIRPVTQAERECRDVEACRRQSIHLLAGAHAKEVIPERPLQPSTSLQTGFDDDEFFD